MVMFLQIGALILVGVIIAEFTIWSWQNRNIWWLVPIPAIIAYLSLLSRLFLRKPDRWLFKVATLLWNTFLGKLLPASLTFGFLLVGTVVGAWGLYSTWHSQPLNIIDIAVPRNNEKSEFNTDVFSLKEMDDRIIDIFDELQEYNDKIVYIRFYTYVGAGSGINDLPKNQKIKAGVVYNLDLVLDGFGGNQDDYSYGYSVELDTYREQWGSSRKSTLLFPAAGNAFFDVHYVKSMRFEGLAKIKVSGTQGFQFIEVVPTIPFGDLKKKYDDAKNRLASNRNRNFEF